MFNYNEFDDFEEQTLEREEYLEGEDDEFIETSEEENEETEDSEFDEEGYDEFGYDVNGYDRDGFDQFGFDMNGYDAEGFDANGIDAEGYDYEGFDANGYDRDGFDREGYYAEGYDMYGYDREGYDRDGFDQFGNSKFGEPEAEPEPEPEPEPAPAPAEPAPAQPQAHTIMGMPLVAMPNPYGGFSVPMSITNNIADTELNRLRDEFLKQDTNTKINSSNITNNEFLRLRDNNSIYFEIARERESANLNAHRLEARLENSELKAEINQLKAQQAQFSSPQQVQQNSFSPQAISASQDFQAQQEMNRLRDEVNKLTAQNLMNAEIAKLKEDMAKSANNNVTQGNDLVAVLNSIKADIINSINAASRQQRQVVSPATRTVSEPHHAHTRHTEPHTRHTTHTDNRPHDYHRVDNRPSDHHTKTTHYDDRGDRYGRDTHDRHTYDRSNERHREDKINNQIRELKDRIEDVQKTNRGETELIKSQISDIKDILEVLSEEFKRLPQLETAILEEIKQIKEDTAGLINVSNGERDEILQELGKLRDTVALSIGEEDLTNLELLDLVEQKLEELKEGVNADTKDDLTNLELLDIIEDKLSDIKGVGGALDYEALGGIIGEQVGKELQNISPVPINLDEVVEKIATRTAPINEAIVSQVVTALSQYVPIPLNLDEVARAIAANLNENGSAAVSGGISGGTIDEATLTQIATSITEAAQVLDTKIENVLVASILELEKKVQTQLEEMQAINESVITEAKDIIVERVLDAVDSTADTIVAIADAVDATHESIGAIAGSFDALTDTAVKYQDLDDAKEIILDRLLDKLDELKDDNALMVLEASNALLDGLKNGEGGGINREELAKVVADAFANVVPVPINVDEIAQTIAEKTAPINAAITEQIKAELSQYVPVPLTAEGISKDIASHLTSLSIDTDKIAEQIKQSIAETSFDLDALAAKVAETLSTEFNVELDYDKIASTVAESLSGAIEIQDIALDYDKIAEVVRQNAANVELDSDAVTQEIAKVVSEAISTSAEQTIASLSTTISENAVESDYIIEKISHEISNQIAGIADKVSNIEANVDTQTLAEQVANTLATDIAALGLDAQDIAQRIVSALEISVDTSDIANKVANVLQTDILALAVDTEDLASRVVSSLDINLDVDDLVSRVSSQVNVDIADIVRATKEEILDSVSNHQPQDLDILSEKLESAVTQYKTHTEEVLSELIQGLNNASSEEKLTNFLTQIEESLSALTLSQSLTQDGLTNAIENLKEYVASQTANENIQELVEKLLPLAEGLEITAEIAALKSKIDDLAVLKETAGAAEGVQRNILSVLETISTDLHADSVSPEAIQELKSHITTTALDNSHARVLDEVEALKATISAQINATENMVVSLANAASQKDYNTEIEVLRQELIQARSNEASAMALFSEITQVIEEQGKEKENTKNEAILSEIAALRNKIEDPARLESIAQQLEGIKYDFRDSLAEITAIKSQIARSTNTSIADIDNNIILEEISKMKDEISANVQTAETRLILAEITRLSDSLLGQAGAEGGRQVTRAGADIKPTTKRGKGAKATTESEEVTKSIQDLTKGLTEDLTQLAKLAAAGTEKDTAKGGRKRTAAKKDEPAQNVGVTSAARGARSAAATKPVTPTPETAKPKTTKRGTKKKDQDTAHALESIDNLLASGMPNMPIELDASTMDLTDMALAQELAKQVAEKMVIQNLFNQLSPDQTTETTNQQITITNTQTNTSQTVSIKQLTEQILLERLRKRFE